MAVSGRSAVVQNAAMTLSLRECLADMIRAIFIALTAVMKTAQTRWSSVMTVENITTMAARPDVISAPIASMRKCRETIKGWLSHSGDAVELVAATERHYVRRRLRVRISEKVLLRGTWRDRGFWSRPSGMFQASREGHGTKASALLPLAGFILMLIAEVYGLQLNQQVIFTDVDNR